MLEVIADTTDQFVDFCPFVPCIDAQGNIAFQARLRTGQTGVFHDDGAELFLADGDFAAVISHPAWVRSQVTFYAALQSGGTALATGKGGVLTEHRNVGPLGPTTNTAGDIAFRADDAIWVYQAGACREVARIGDRYIEFHGLPVATVDGRVVFRADLNDGSAVIMRECEIIHQTNGELGRFPCVNALGHVAFAVPNGIFVAKPELAPVAMLNGPYTFRGALVGNADAVVAIATPHGGQLGIYADHNRLIGIGDQFLGSEVVDFALNPVSINTVGDMAIRIKLANDIQAIVRWNG